MKYTLDPDEDRAALTAMFLYARIKKDEALFRELQNAKTWGTGSEGDCDGFDWGQLDNMSSPHERSLDAAEAWMKRFGLEPLYFVTRQTVTGSSS